MNKKIRSLIVFTLILAICLGLCSCGKKDKKSDTDISTTREVTEEGGSATGSVTPTGEIVEGKRNLIIDTDTGADDASALILAALNPNVNVVGVTVLVGNVDLEQSTKNAIMALEMAGCDAPVFKGSATTYDGVDRTAFSVFGEDGMGDADLIHPSREADEGDAVDFIINTVKAHPGEIEIVALGPATNVAKAISKDPETMKNVKRIWSMGTTGLGVGNATPVAEFNVYSDAEAYKIMIASGLPITIVGFDVCGGDASWTDDQFVVLKEQGEVGSFVGESFGKIREFYKNNGSEDVENCDCLAMMCALYPGFVKEEITVHGSCIADKGETYGQVIFYKQGFTYDGVDASTLDYNATLVTDVEGDKYFANFVDAINGKFPEAEGTGDGKDDKTDDGKESDGTGKNGEIYILYTSDVHCGVDEGFGYAGLKDIRDNLEAEGYETILVDDGDAIQGDSIGTLSKGEAIIDLMNDLHYDVAIPGNHEFDYGMEQFLALTEKADYPYISCNFNKEGNLIFDPYVIKEVAGIKIGFVGVTTPESLISSTPRYFQNDKGEYIYGFMEDSDGTGVYDAVQKAVDDARADGAQLVFVMAHLGNEGACEPWTYADVLSHTNGIDMLFDGHSHDTDQIEMKNKDGDSVTRSAVGTKLHNIGYVHISADGEIVDTGLWSWPNDESLQELINVDNEISRKIDEAMEKLDEEMGAVVASTDVDLTIFDPNEKDSQGNPIRIVRLTETNLGDLVADAYRDQAGADIAFINGGGIRANIEKGDITNGDLISVQPYGNELCVIEVTGQQILDALEWGAHKLPEENGGFLQVSGLSYEVDVNIESSCVVDENTMFAGVSSERRVKNVMVGDEPIDPDKTYTLAGHNYMIQEHGDGYTMFDGSKLLQDRIKLDNQVLIDYITDTLGGVVGDEYSDPYGQGRIKITD